MSSRPQLDSATISAKLGPSAWPGIVLKALPGTVSGSSMALRIKHGVRTEGAKSTWRRGVFSKAVRRFAWISHGFSMHSRPETAPKTHENAASPAARAPGSRA